MSYEWPSRDTALQGRRRRPEAGSIHHRQSTYGRSCRREQKESVYTSAKVHSRDTNTHPAYFHPFFLAAWTALASILIQYFGWWPKPELPWWTYMKPLPAFAAFLVPLMFIVDLLVPSRPSEIAEVDANRLDPTDHTSKRKHSMFCAGRTYWISTPTTQDRQRPASGFSNMAASLWALSLLTHH